MTTLFGNSKLPTAALPNNMNNVEMNWSSFLSSWEVSLAKIMGRDLLAPPPAPVVTPAAPRLLSTMAKATGVTVGLAVAGGFCYWQYRVFRREYLLEQAREKLRPVVDINAAGVLYSPELRDCLAGEQADLVVDEEEDAPPPSPPADEEPPVAHPLPGHGPAHGPARRRVLKRKKYAHMAVSGDGIMNEGFLGFVVAKAKAAYGGRRPDDHNRQLARMFMIREMQNANVRPSHISEHIGKMVAAVWYVSSQDVEAAELWKAVINQRAALDLPVA